MEILIVLSLIVLNGVLAMAEIAIVSSRKSRLQQEANEGNSNAQAALDLSNAPNRFLSTVQIGITFIGIFAGAFGGETIAQNLSQILSSVPLIAPYSEALGLLFVVSAITYLSLVIGEIVPKRLALNNPEEAAKLIAQPMNLLSKVTSPLVSLLTVSADSILHLLHAKPSDNPTISEEEVKLLMKEGARVGVFDIAEKDIVERTLRLGDKNITSMMTPRGEIVWLNIENSFESIKNRVTRTPHAYYPVCKEGLDKVLGIIQTNDLLSHFLAEENLDLTKTMHKPIFVPDTMEALRVLEIFKQTGIHIALIVDEYGSVIGLLSLADILEEIVGDIPTADELVEEDIMKRDNGSFFVDGLVTLDELKEFFKIKKIPGEKAGTFHTVGGLAMAKIGRVPVSGDTFELGSLHFEVIDMDDNRVDKVMITTT